MTELVRGRYEILGVVGRGGEGEVVRALDTQHSRYVALKVRHPTSQGGREALLREARVLLNLEPHPGIPLVRDDFFEDERYYVVMDWVDGKNLHDLLAEASGSGLPADRALSILEQVAAALDHLHGHDPIIVHRDVKPANIIVDDAGRARLVDFGISSEPATMTLRGTPGFMAPELLQGDHPTPASDVFALAVTAFLLFTGERPRPGVSPELTDVPPERSGVVADAFAEGLAADPSGRPPSAGAFVRLLRSAVDDGPPLTERTPSRPLLRRAVVAAVVLLVASGTAFSATRIGSRTPDASPPAAPTASPRQTPDPRLYAASLTGDGSDFQPLAERGGPEGAAEIRHETGAVVFSVHRPGGNAGTEPAMESVSTYSGLIRLAVDPGTETTFDWGLRWGSLPDAEPDEHGIVKGTLAYIVRVRTATEHLEVVFRDLEAPGPEELIAPVPIEGLRSGRAVEIGVTMREDRLQVRLDGEEVADVAADRMSAGHTVPSLDIFGNPGTGTVRLTALTIWDLGAEASV